MGKVNRYEVLERNRRKKETPEVEQEEGWERRRIKKRKDRKRGE